MAYFIQLVLAGIALGCIYALIGLGFSIIFKATGVINFAQGELLLVGAYILSAGVFEWKLAFWLALIIAIAFTVIIALLFERFLGAGFHEITPYLIMILVLLIRPYGLFGTRKVERL